MMTEKEYFEDKGKESCVRTLPQSDDVRHDALSFETPEMSAHPPKPHLAPEEQHSSTDSGQQRRCVYNRPFLSHPSGSIRLLYSRQTQQYAAAAVIFFG